jgi:hypothetical protein
MFALDAHKPGYGFEEERCIFAAKSVIYKA